jgi:hypothetical protein
MKKGCFGRTAGSAGLWRLNGRAGERWSVQSAGWAAGPGRRKRSGRRASRDGRAARQARLHRMRRPIAAQVRHLFPRNGVIFRGRRVPEGQPGRRKRGHRAADSRSPIQRHAMPDSGKTQRSRALPPGGLPCYRYPPYHPPRTTPPSSRPQHQEKSLHE